MRALRRSTKNFANDSSRFLWLAEVARPSRGAPWSRVHASSRAAFNVDTEEHMKKNRRQDRPDAETPVHFDDDLKRMIVLLGWNAEAIACHARRVLAESGMGVAGFDIAIDTVGMIAVRQDDGTVDVVLNEPAWVGAMANPDGSDWDDFFNEQRPR
jgi:hypothetical protein